MTSVDRDSQDKKVVSLDRFAKTAGILLALVCVLIVLQNLAGCILVKDVMVISETISLASLKAVLLDSCLHSFCNQGSLGIIIPLSGQPKYYNVQTPTKSGKTTRKYIYMYNWSAYGRKILVHVEWDAITNKWFLMHT